MFLRLAYLLLLLNAAQAWPLGYLSMDEKGPAKKEKKAPEGAGDVQVGPAVSAEPTGEVPKLQRASPGIFPVYEAEGGWLLVDRSAAGKKSSLAKGAPLLVIGSEGAELFSAARTSWTWSAGCSERKPAKILAWRLTAGRKSAFAKVGVPVIALKLKRGASPDLAKARFSALRSDVSEGVYQRLDAPIRRSALADLQGGTFPGLEEDEAARALARSQDASKLQMKIDFGAPIRVRGLQKGFVLVEGTQAGGSYRRCLRLFDDATAVGGCAPMPHVLMAETRLLRMAAYDPSGAGAPFLLAYTASEPLWGHERWGFKLGKDGPSLFLHDALDPRCREGF